MRAETFQKIILKWYAEHGRTTLPWQQNKTPYRVWVSEIMLQQTQVATVIPYFERFMQHFPDILSLAKAKEDDVLHLWAGLGYYSRARNLKRTANVVLEKFNGCIPNTLSDLLELPGIGHSTAGAILSIAFNQSAAILDGNVKRVLTRLHGIQEPIDDKQVENKLWALAKHYAPAKKTAAYTQAMMDLGATLCLRREPKCHRCPLKRYCVAKKKDLTHLLPFSNKKKALPIRTATFLVFKKKNQLLLEKRPPKGIWGSLWSFPEISGQPDLTLIQAYCAEKFQTHVSHYDTLPVFRHTFTHYHLDIHPILFSIDKISLERGAQIWYNPDKPKMIGLPTPTQTIVNRLT